MTIFTLLSFLFVHVSIFVAHWLPLPWYSPSPSNSPSPTYLTQNQIQILDETKITQKNNPRFYKMALAQVEKSANERALKQANKVAKMMGF